MKPKHFLLAIPVLYLLVYLTGFMMTWEPNPAKWDSDGRGMTAMTCFFVTAALIVASMVYYHNNNTKGRP